MNNSQVNLKVDALEFKALKGDLLLFSLIENNIFKLNSNKTRARGAFCGMGVCQECLVKINKGEKLACQTIIKSDMEVNLNE